MTAMRWSLDRRTVPTDRSDTPTPRRNRELAPIMLDGVEQWVLVRGRSDHAPILPKIHGSAIYVIHE